MILLVCLDLGYFIYALSFYLKFVVSCLATLVALDPTPVSQSVAGQSFDQRSFEACELVFLWMIASWIGKRKVS